MRTVRTECGNAYLSHAQVTQIYVSFRISFNNLSISAVSLYHLLDYVCWVVTVTSARTNTNVPRIGARLPLPGSIDSGAQHGKLDADLRTSALPGTSSVQSVHDYYPSAMEDGGRLVPMAAELVDRLALLVAVRRFLGMGATNSRSLRYDIF